ncbi:MAG TPA: aminotransferase class IV, partial [Urbifossiella sp.]|nr:aminotransferase class IV [Urbifossiella sp.]
PIELYGHGLHVATCPYPINTAAPAAWHHALGRPDVVLARRHALKAGCLEAVLTDPAGAVIGTTEGELFLVRSGAVARVGLTGGVEADAVWEFAAEQYPGAPTRSVTPGALAEADEVFLVGTACGVIGVVCVDGRVVGSGTEGPVTRAVRDEYRKLTRGQDTIPTEGGAP